MSFSETIREANEAERDKHAAALRRELQENGVPALRDLGSLRALKNRHPLPADVFDRIVEKARARKS